MKFTPETDDIGDYLRQSDIIDFDSSEVKAIAKTLSKDAKSDVEIAKAVCEYVRDAIPHSFDAGGKVVTCRASDVLKHKEGICYAKSHLLAAIMRSLSIPTGFCYQKLPTGETNQTRYIIHALNAIYLESIGKWIRVDARGNKEGVTADFDVDREMIAFRAEERAGVVDYPTIYAMPNDKVVESLNISKSLSELSENLPDEL